MSRLDSKEIRKRALLAADWYVRSQLPENRPQWDANAGRFIYNYHLPTRTRVSGLSWTQGRGVMVLMAAHRLTGKAVYLETAQRALAYVRALQEYDQAQPYFGAMHEEIPQSGYCYPRDGSEAAAGYLHVYNKTGDKDLLRRAKIFGDWMLSVTDPKTGFPPIGSYFNPVKQARTIKAFMAGNGMFYGLLYQATGEKKYLTRGLLPLADGVGKRFLEEDGALVDRHFDAHHTKTDKSGRLLVLNDDGLCAALLMAGRITGQARYIEQSIRIADWMMGVKPVTVFSSLPSQLCFIMDVWKETGMSRYRDYVLRRLPEVLRLQVVSSKDPWALGAFRGEDELAKWYVKGARQSDFVTNRVTCYTALTLFKLVNGDFTPGYSAFGWKR